MSLQFIACPYCKNLLNQWSPHVTGGIAKYHIECYKKASSPFLTVMQIDIIYEMHPRLAFSYG